MKIKNLFLCLMIFLTVIPFTSYASSYTFNDLKGNEWFYKSAEKLQSLGIMIGDKNNNFNPNQYITRAELADIISKTIDQDDEENKTINVVAQTVPLVVRISTDTSETTVLPAKDGMPQRWMTDYKVASGSGVFVGNNLILTNFHIVDGGKKYKIETSDGNMYEGQLVKEDNVKDLALLKINNNNNNSGGIQFSDDVSRGETAIVIGHPGIHEDNDLILKWSASKGIVSNPTVNTGYHGNRIQIDTTINSGNSGSPIVNMEGQMIGLVVSSADPDKTENIAFGVRVETIKEFLSEYKK